MSADARALHLFDELLALSAGAREATLAALRHDDPEAHALLQSMLRADARRHLIDQPWPGVPQGPAAAADDPRIGTRLGPWRIERRIAEGGMGAVYEAHRDDGQYRQRVALKCVRADLVSPQLLEAFRAEREHLAQLEHPHIATLLDGGVDADGIPWFAMRYVEGEPIDAWCDQCRLPLEARVDLFAQACDAVAHAHARGIVHRDIKPSNLLVTPPGKVHVLDFGLSHPGHAEGGAPLAVSPGYTAPEVLRGAAPGAQADVFSLGIVLARLLGGFLPSHSLLGGALLDERLPPLSRLAREAPEGTAAWRGFADEAALAQRLRGDLDALVARCVDPDPARRYPDAAALADDLRRWRAQRPVAARAGGWLYRSGRLVARHRVVAGLAGMVLLSALVGVGSAWWLQQRAQREAAASASVAALFERTLGTAALSGLGEVPLSSARLLEQTEAQVRASGLQDQPQVLMQALDSLARGYAVIGDYRHATALANEAATINAGDHDAQQHADATLASLLNIQARHAEARQVAQRALDAMPADGSGRPLRVRLMAEIARSRWNEGERDAARAMLEEARALARQEPDPAMLVELLLLRGDWSRRMLVPAAAAADADRALALAAPDSLLADEAKRLRGRVFQQQESTREALALFQAVAESQAMRLGEQHPETARTLLLLAYAQGAVRDKDAAWSTLARAQRLLAAAYGTEHVEYGESLRVAASLHAWVGQAAEAEAAGREALRIFEQAYGPRHENTLRMRALFGINLLLPGATPAQRTEGIGALRQVAADSRQTGVPAPYAQLSLAKALAWQGQAGDFQEAAVLLAQAQADIKRALGAGHPAHNATQSLGAYLRYRIGDLDGAEALLQAAVPRLIATLPNNNAAVGLCTVTQVQAAILSAKHQPAQATAWLREALALREAKPALFLGDTCGPKLDQAVSALRRTGRYVMEKP